MDYRLIPLASALAHSMPVHMAVHSRTIFQIVPVVLGMAGLSILTDYANFRSGWNILWMVGLPGVTAGVLGRKDTWFLSALWLLLLGCATMLATAALLHLGP